MSQPPFLDISLLRFFVSAPPPLIKKARSLLIFHFPSGILCFGGFRVCPISSDPCRANSFFFILIINPKGLFLCFSGFHRLKPPAISPIATSSVSQSYS